MISDDSAQLCPIPWTEAEPTRLSRDQLDVTGFDASLRYLEPGDHFGDRLLSHGGWHGVLPLWPFERPAPSGLDALTGGIGLEFLLSYRAAYPMVPPIITPLSPKPEVYERTQAMWHVLPGGGICMFQSDGAWQPEASLVDLLLKAAGWRIEYALMKCNVIDKMSIAGIVSDGAFDPLIAKAMGSLGDDGKGD